MNQEDHTHQDFSEYSGVDDKNDDSLETELNETESIITRITSHLTQLNQAADVDQVGYAMQKLYSSNFKTNFEALDEQIRDKLAEALFAIVKEKLGFLVEYLANHYIDTKNLNITARQFTIPNIEFIGKISSNAKVILISKVAERIEQRDQALATWKSEMNQSSAQFRERVEDEDNETKKIYHRRMGETNHQNPGYTYSTSPFELNMTPLKGTFLTDLDLSYQSFNDLSREANKLLS
jgi:hypothetical protein